MNLTWIIQAVKLIRMIVLKQAKGSSMSKYNVEYDAPDGVRRYCMCNMDLDTARIQLQNFKNRYLNEDGTGKEYPNKKGFYPFSNPRIVKV